MRVLGGVGLGSSVAVIALLLVNCVADEPDTGGSTDDAATSNPDATSSNDGNVTSTDSGVDAAIDPCNGSINCPSQQNPAHLQLWLRSDLGVDCTGNRVSTWHDQSGHGRDAHRASYPDGGVALAPHCGGATLNSRPVISFTAPSGVSAPYVDEVFNVDLSFVAGSDYTVLVVHRPLYPISDNLGTGLLGAVQSKPLIISICKSNAPAVNDGMFDLALVHGDDAGTVALQYDGFPHCVPYQSTEYAPTAATIDVFEFSKLTGHTIIADGVTLFSGTAEGDDTLAVSADAGVLSPGVLGRDSDDGLIDHADTRYAGDIAEVIVYDAPLNSELGALSQYFKATWNL